MNKPKVDVEMIKETPKMSFGDWMSEKKAIDRWAALGIALFGAFAGVLFTVIWMMLGATK